MTRADALKFTVEDLGLVPESAFGPSAALGSGCSPGTDVLPDGVWYGWITKATADSISFDLACFWPGRFLEPTVSNDASSIRSVPVAADARIYPGKSDPVAYDDWSANLVTREPANAPVLPLGYSLWLFVNDGSVTEVTVYDRPVHWARAARAWPPGMFPGCCGDGTIAPSSPADAWPDQGWPADGFYELWVDTETDDYLDVEIVRWHSCGDRPELCLDSWVGDEVVTDPDEERLRRRLSFDKNLTVVIMPIAHEEQVPVVGDGPAYRDLLRDLDESIDMLQTDYADVWDFPEALQESTSDPNFPFGPILLRGEETDAFGYRGPGRALFSWWPIDGHGWWHVLEIRNREPILYLHAGIIAG